MEVGFVGNGIGYVQKKVFDGAHYFSGDTIVGKLCGKPVAVLAGCADTVLSTVKQPLTAIEAVVISALNLVGSAFSEDCRDDLGDSCLFALGFTGLTLVHGATASFKLVCQVALGLWDHQAADSVSDKGYEATDALFFGTRTVSKRAPALPKTDTPVDPSNADGKVD